MTPQRQPTQPPPVQSVPVVEPWPDEPVLALRAWLFARDGERDTYPVTLQEVRTVWACSDRTARRTLQQAHAGGTLAYLPGRGRGITSRVTFAVPLQEALTAALTRLIAARNLDGVARVLRLPFPRAWVFTRQVQALFGLTEPAPGLDVLRMAVTRDLGSLDPLLASNTFEAHLLQQVMDPLVTLDGTTGELLPHLAHHWDTAPDGLTWTFWLRKGVQFHHGRTLDAHDVKFTLDRTRHGAAWLLPDLERVSVHGPHAVRLHLSRRDAFLPWRLCDTPALVLPRDLPFHPDRLTGTGAFRFTRLPAGLRLTAFDAHFAGRPLIDEVEYWNVPDRQHGGPTSVQVQGEGAAAQPHWQAEVGVQFLIWNAHRPATHDPHLRRAVHELYDVHAYWRDVGRTDPLVPASSFYPRRSAARGVPERREAHAAALLRDTRAAPLVLYALSWPEPQAEAAWLAGRCRRHGLHVEVRPFDLDLSPLPTDGDMVMLGEVAGVHEHLAFLSALQHPQLLFRQLLPPALLRDVDAHLDTYRTARTHRERENILDAVEHLLLRDDWLTLTYHRVKRRQLHPLIRDVHPDAYGRLDLKRLWIDRPGVDGA